MMFTPMLLQELHSNCYLDPDWQTLCGGQWGDNQETATMEGSVLHIVMFPVCLPTNQNCPFQLPVKAIDTLQLYTKCNSDSHVKLKTSSYLLQ